MTTLAEVSTLQVTSNPSVVIIKPSLRDFILTWITVEAGISLVFNTENDVTVPCIKYAVVIERVEVLEFLCTRISGNCFE